MPYKLKYDPVTGEILEAHEVVEAGTLPGEEPVSAEQIVEQPPQGGQVQQESAGNGGILAKLRRAAYPPEKMAQMRQNLDSEAEKFKQWAMTPRGGRRGRVAPPGHYTRRPVDVRQLTSHAAVRQQLRSLQEQALMRANPEAIGHGAFVQGSELYGTGDTAAVQGNSMLSQGSTLGHLVPGDTIMPLPRPGKGDGKMVTFPLPRGNANSNLNTDMLSALSGGKYRRKK